MSALNDFVVAAGSYFGLPEGRVMQGSTVETQDGEMELVLRIVLTTDDVVGIGKRMGVMLTEAQVDTQQAVKRDVVGEAPPLSNSELRAQWDGLPASQRSAFGSFAKFKAAYEQAGAEWPLRTSRGVTLPPHVWVPGSELTGPQMAMAMSMDEQGRYAVDPYDLAPEQRTRLGIVLPEERDL